MTKEEKTVGKKAVQLLVEHSYGPETKITGCDEDEIRDLESEFNVALPEAYKSCMRHLGKNPNGFRRGSEFAYPEMKRQREFAQKRVEENDVDFKFDESDFVFMGHQGYSFLFFDTDEGDNPPVYLFMSPNEPYKLNDSFSEWLFNEIRQ